MRQAKGYTLFELLIVILIVAILSAIAVPILHGRIDAAKWTEGRSMAGSIAEAIRTWSVLTDKRGSFTQDDVNFQELGFGPGEFEGVYFGSANFQWEIAYVGRNLDYVITILKPDGIRSPPTMTLDDSGNWDE